VHRRSIQAFLAAIMIIVAGTSFAQDNTKRTRMTEDWGTKKTSTVKEDKSARKSRVVVVPAIYSEKDRSRFTREVAEKLGVKDPSVIENPSYTTFLIDALTNTEALDVLEREDLISAVKELDFGESDYADAKKVARLGEMLNADYVVIPEIRYIAFSEKKKVIPYIGRSRTKYSVKLATAVRAVDVRTSRIASSHISEVEEVISKQSDEVLSKSGVRDLLGQAYRQSGSNEASIVVKMTAGSK